MTLLGKAKASSSTNISQKDVMLRASFAQLGDEINSLKDRMTKIEENQKNMMQRIEEVAEERAQTKIMEKALVAISAQSDQNFSEIQNLKAENGNITTIQTRQDAKLRQVEKDTVSTFAAIEGLRGSISEKSVGTIEDSVHKDNKPEGTMEEYKNKYNILLNDFKAANEEIKRLEEALLQSTTQYCRN